MGVACHLTMVRILQKESFEVKWEGEVVKEVMKVAVGAS